MTAKAIETRYKGCRFRSRLEARWAVLFDSLGLEWLYEREGFSLPSGPYLPDFWMRAGGALSLAFPDPGWWVEIKPVAPTDKEVTLMLELVSATGHNGFIFAGDVFTRVDVYPCVCARSMSDVERLAAADGSMKAFLPTTEYRMNAAGEFHPDNRPAFMATHGCPSVPDLILGFGGYVPSIDQDGWEEPVSGKVIESRRFQQAAEAARAARFEHGEQG